MSREGPLQFSFTQIVHYQGSGNLHLLDNIGKSVFRGPNKWGPSSFILHVDSMTSKSTRVQDVLTGSQVTTFSSKVKTCHAILSLVKDVRKHKYTLQTVPLLLGKNIIC